MENEKLIIQVKGDISILDALEYAKEVIRLGKISNNNTQYCYATTFLDNIVVYSDKNKKSHRLTVQKYRKSSD